MENFPVLQNRLKILFFIALFVLCLYPVTFVLSTKAHGLLLYVAARDSNSASAVYGKINQVFATVTGAPQGPFFKLAHSVPNFDSYSIRLNGKGDWHRWHAHELPMKPALDGTFALEIKAHNRLGGETAVFTFTLKGTSDAASARQASSPAYAFEDWQAPGVELFQRYTKPLVSGQALTWNRALAVFAWASGFLRIGEEIKLHLPPVAILQERLRNPHSRFLCGSFATFFIAACHSVGVNARLVHLQRRNGEGHYVAEAWSDQHQKWIVMDPMYKRVFCDTGDCYSALDLREQYLSGLKAPSAASASPRDAAYLSLYDDIRYFTSNTFFTSPPTTFLNLVFGTPPVLHWSDGQSRPIDKKKELGKLLLFYYLPRILDAAILPAALFVMVYVLAWARRRIKKLA